MEEILLVDGTGRLRRAAAVCGACVFNFDVISILKIVINSNRIDRKQAARQSATHHSRLNNTRPESPDRPSRPTVRVGRGGRTAKQNHCFVEIW
jgi:hypothetical protein